VAIAVWKVTAVALLMLLLFWPSPCMRMAAVASPLLLLTLYTLHNAAFWAAAYTAVFYASAVAAVVVALASKLLLMLTAADVAAVVIAYILSGTT
jgi:hypothetical protein